MRAVIINPANGESITVLFRSVRTSCQQGEIVIALLYAADTFKTIDKQYGHSMNDTSFYCNTNCTIHIMDK